MAVEKEPLRRSLIPGGVCAAKGFRVAGVRCGIKRKRRDIALLVCDAPDGKEATAAATFTQNRLRAPCADRGETIIRNGDGEIRAIVVNAGNANAGNGPQGVKDNEAMAFLAAAEIGSEPSRVLTASTGIIGNPMPMERVASGIREAAAALTHSAEAASEAAEAILTTDTFSKEYAIEVEIDGIPVRIGGMAKGSGMIAPNMATMLAFITTDAAVAAPVLQLALKRAVDISFNRLTVDGDTSTNDSCFLLASGASGGADIQDDQSPAFEDFLEALTEVCVHLAKEIARDGEGATKLVTVTVFGAEQEKDADAIARTIAESPLVKTALFGNDPNWGRILAASGRAGVPFDPQKVTATLAGTTIFSQGIPTDFDAAALSKAMSAKEVTITVDLSSGDATATFYTCDFSYDYVRINAEYHT
jgi:glutamate N-acetyltransferase/amino-acid N-acetyltransferase